MIMTKVAGICANGFKLGVKPDEFEVVQFHGQEPPVMVSIKNFARCGRDHEHIRLFDTL